MTIANLTRSLLCAVALLLGGAAAVAADEPDDGVLGGALGGATEEVELASPTSRGCSSLLHRDLVPADDRIRVVGEA